MPQHIHSNNEAQLVGFYFIEVPKNSPVVVLHDPRPGKVQSGIWEQDRQKYSSASNIVCLPPEEGMMIITNSWLPHSFTQNISNKSFKFIHFNIGVSVVEEKKKYDLEII